MTKVFDGYYGKFLIRDPFNPHMFMAGEESGTKASYVDARMGKRVRVLGGWGTLGHRYVVGSGL
jgi:hypothetical protein